MEVRAVDNTVACLWLHELRYIRAQLFYLFPVAFRTASKTVRLTHPVVHIFVCRVLSVNMVMEHSVYRRALCRFVS